MPKKKAKRDAYGRTIKEQICLADSRTITGSSSACENQVIEVTTSFSKGPEDRPKKQDLGVVNPLCLTDGDSDRIADKVTISLPEY